jgi:hypothetical protein
MKRIAIAVLAALLASSACTPAEAITTPEEIEKLSDKETLALLECQGRKVAEDMGTEEAKRYVSDKLEALMEEGKKSGDATVQSRLAEDGYYCTMAEVEKVIKEAKRQEQIEQWGPPAQLQDVRPGLLGGAFVGDVEYQIDKETTGFWMGISKNKELIVSTSAETEPEIHELAQTLKEKEAEGFDFIRAEWFGGKQDLDQDRYNAAGTIVIMTSKDGLSLFGDQYPNGPAYERAKQDFKNGDGIVFLGSME